MAIPSTTSKTIVYVAIRGVNATGPGALSNRGAVSRFNETIDGVVYNSYHTSYKTSGGTKRVNGFNRQSTAQVAGIQQRKRLSELGGEPGRELQDVLDGSDLERA